MEQQGKPKEITILALGGAGCRILRALADAPAAPSLRLLAADTDAESLARSGVAENCRQLAGARWRGGRGCGTAGPRLGTRPCCWRTGPTAGRRAPPVCGRSGSGTYGCPWGRGRRPGSGSCCGSGG